jgi:AbrB family looped-hinge helix DNA binding protein
LGGGDRGQIDACTGSRGRAGSTPARHPRCHANGNPPGAIFSTSPPKLYSSSMTIRVGAKGQVVIPKAVREQAQLHPGDEVEVAFADEQIVISARRRGASLGGRFAKSGMAERLLKDRRREPR